MKNKLENIANELCVQFVVLFGSQAKGHATERSDYDVAYQAGSPLMLAEAVELASAVAAFLEVSEDKIDLVNVDAGSPLFQFEVATHGRLLCGQQRDFIKFQLLAWKRYQHTAKFRRFREYALAQKYGA
jgi:predicted nucleotidyltransferase